MREIKGNNGSDHRGSLFEHEFGEKALQPERLHFHALANGDFRSSLVETSHDHFGAAGDVHAPGDVVINRTELGAVALERGY